MDCDGNNCDQIKMTDNCENNIVDEKNDEDSAAYGFSSARGHAAPESNDPG